MILFKPLTRRPITLLWSALVCSAIGDEFYKIALIWLAVSLVGHAAGYVGAAEGAAACLCGLFAGIWTDTWDHRRTMILADVARGCIVLIPVGVAFFQPVSLWLLIATAIAVGGLKPFFDPALYALIPRLVQDQRLRQATNGLIDVTPRVARILGPAMVSVLHQCLPILHFLTLDAMTFFLSALAIWRVKRALRDDAPAQVANPAGGVRAILDMFYSVAGFPLMQFLVYGHAVASSAWYLGFILSTALLLHERMPDQIGSYGLVLASYGIGNVASTVLVANLVITRAVRFMFMGRCGPQFCRVCLCARCGDDDRAGLPRRVRRTDAQPAVSRALASALCPCDGGTRLSVALDGRTGMHMYRATRLASSVCTFSNI